MTANYSTLPPPPPPTTSRNTRFIVGCVIAGAVLFVALAVGVVAVGGLLVSRNLNITTAAGVPSDFPVYPHALRQASFTVGARDNNPRHSISMAQWSARGGSARVRRFYEESLNTGDWEILSHHFDRYSFRRRSTGAVAQLQIQDQVIQTLVQLAMTGDQPLGAGTHPQ